MVAVGGWGRRVLGREGLVGRESQLEKGEGVLEADGSDGHTTT